MALNKSFDFDIKPLKNFKSKFNVVGCRVEFNKKYLLLLRHGNKPEAHTWGEPAGKIEKGENITKAMAREIKEETGINIDKNDLIFVKTFYVRYPDYDFIYHAHYLELKKLPLISIDQTAHKKYCWLSRKELLQIPLIGGLDELYKKYHYLYLKNNQRRKNGRVTKSKFS